MVKLVKCNGIILLEVLFYLPLSLFLFYFLFLVSIRAYQDHKHLLLQMQQQTMYWRVIDLLLNDLEQAPAEPAQWKYTNHAGAIWHLAEKDIGWLLRNHNLYRLEGNFSGKSWLSKTTSLVATNIDEFRVLPYVHDGFIKTIDCSFKASNKSWQGTIELINGVYG